MYVTNDMFTDMQRMLVMQKKHRLTLFMLALIICLTSVLTASASSVKDLQSEKKKTQKQLDSVEDDIKDLERDTKRLQKELDQLDDQLVELLMTIDILETEMSEKDQQIEQAKVDLEAAQADQDSQYEAMKQRIRYMYEQGESDWISIFLESDSISSMLNKAEYVKEIYDYDRQKLEEFIAVTEQVADLEETLEAEKAEMEGMRGEYELEQQSLQALIDEKQKTASDFDAQLAAAKKKAKNYQAQLTKQTQEIKRLQEESRKAAEASKKAAEASKKAAEDAKKKEQAAAGGSSSGGSLKPDQSASELGNNEGTAKGREIVDYACQFIGNAYVLGGTSLTNGADCSGFVQSVFKNFGISVPRSSSAQRTAGTSVAYSEAQPGDVICYAGHVAIYMGNGRIVHASNPKSGITTGSATFRTILSIRRFI